MQSNLEVVCWFSVYEGSVYMLENQSRALKIWMTA